jgi:regulator of sirC expression with transglutaminase-like and TPR domain
MFKAVAGNHVELTPEHYRDMGNRDILLRLQGNIKSRLIQREQWDDALEVIQTMLMFAPAQTSLWREAGLLHAKLDRIKDAIRALEEFQRRTGAEDRRYKTSMLLQELRARLN